MACHWRHPVADYPLTGDAVHAALARWPRLSRVEEEDFLLDVLVPGGAVSVARRRGCSDDAGPAPDGAARSASWCPRTTSGCCCRPASPRSRVAAAHPALRGLAVHVVPVLDACSDDSGEVAPGALEVTARNVGIARAAGFAEVLRREAGRPPGELWLATTDADSTVPADWLAEQLRLARGGAEVVAGTVRVADWSEQPGRGPGAVRRARYGAPGAGHVHVHGANLGLSAAAYLDAGGVPPLALAEDQALVDTLRARARRLVATGRIPVTTSARRESRTTGGFADHLRALH